MPVDGVDPRAPRGRPGFRATDHQRAKAGMPAVELEETAQIRE